MNKSIWIILAGVAILSITTISKYNTMVDKEETVITQWANIETQYQRRADLIPNLVNTVKGYASHEKETLEAVIKARATATSIKIDASNLTPAMIQKYQAAQGGVTSALSKLLAVSERYPDLKANQNFLELQAQLEGTENRISVERRRYNEITKNYNVYIRKFPTSMLAGMFGFERKPPFESAKGSEKAPKVTF
jgi:LemA protein